MENVGGMVKTAVKAVGGFLKSLGKSVMNVGNGIAKSVLSAVGSTRSISLLHHIVPFRSCWASSVYSYRYLWWYFSFPASNAANWWSYWASAGNHRDEDIVTWQGDFPRIFRITHMWIIWAIAANEISIQLTTDGATWKEVRPWFKLYPYHSYSQHVQFECA